MMPTNPANHYHYGLFMYVCVGGGGGGQKIQWSCGHMEILVVVETTNVRPVFQESIGML